MCSRVPETHQEFKFLRVNGKAMVTRVRGESRYKDPRRHRDTGHSSRSAKGAKT